MTETSPPSTCTHLVSGDYISQALLGHDLRAALAEMRNCLQLVQEAGVPAHLQEPLARCRTVGEAVSRLIDQSVLVCLGQASAASTSLSVVQTDEYLTDLHQRWTGRCAETGHSFHLHMVGELPDSFLADRAALDRVVGNLVSNAQTHTPPGPIRLTFKISDIDLLLIVVEDDGPGFPDAFLAELETHFALPPEARRPGGGLGLQSVKHLVAAMGGHSYARNKTTGGAEIGICLPLPPLVPPPATGRETDDAQAPLAVLPDLQGTAILCADDSATSREVVGLLARRLKAEIRAVPDGLAAMAALQEPGYQPDILILDDEMPGASGIDVLHWLRGQTSALRDLPVLALTSHIGKAEIDALYTAGASEVLTKPVLLPTELGRAIARAQGRAPAPPRQQAHKESVASGDGFDLSVLQRLSQIAGPEASAELFQRMEEDLLSARDGLAKASVAGDLAAIRAHSHVIIALAGTAGAAALHDDAVTLNGMAHANAPTERIIALAKRLDGTIFRLAQAVRGMAAEPKSGACGP